VEVFFALPLRVPPVAGPDCFLFFAALLAWRERAAWEAAPRGSRLSACEVARDREADFFFVTEPDFAGLFPFARSRSADLRVRSDALPFFGGFKATPAGRALDNPMAMACLVDLAENSSSGWTPKHRATILSSWPLILCV